ncbi:multidrug resistance-associated protein 5 [Tanacetum coccineum]
MLCKMVSLCGMKGVEKLRWYQSVDKDHLGCLIPRKLNKESRLGISTLVHWSTISGFAKIFGDKIRANLDISLCDIADLVMKRYKCKIPTDGKTYFGRFSMCFAGLADGWKAGYRKIIALDGCFLKNPNQGKILTTIGRDGNNHIYLVAWAVVNVKNKDIWTWFLELLEEDLGCSRGNGLRV